DVAEVFPGGMISVIASVAKQSRAAKKDWIASSLRSSQWRRILPLRPKKIPQQRRGFALTNRRINFRRVMAGRLGEEPHAGIHRATLGVGRAVIESPDPRQRDRARAHGAWLQRDIEIAI